LHAIIATVVIGKSQPHAAEYRTLFLIRSPVDQRAMSRLFRKRVSGPQLSPETIRRVDTLFLPEDGERAKTLLYEQCGNSLPFQDKADMYQLERLRFAALKYSDGNLTQLESAVKLAQRDWRDLLVATGFANNVQAHRAWEPKPAGEPAEINAPLLAATIHERLGTLLIPLGFERRGDEWRRGGEVPQTLSVKTGLTSRIEVKFFLQATLEAKPIGVMLHLPRLPSRMEDLQNQGYVFRAGDSEETLRAAIVRDFTSYCQPWFQRFTSESEVRRGLEDGTFAPNIRAGDKVLVF
jgi:hypothetical protein